MRGGAPLDGVGGRTRLETWRRWGWGTAVVALGVLAFLAVRGPFRVLTVGGVVLAILALVRPRAAGR